MTNADKLFDKGRQLWESANGDEDALLMASTYLRRAIDADYTHAPSHVALSFVLGSLEQREDATKEAEIAVKLAPDSFSAWKCYYNAFASLWAYLKANSGPINGARSLLVERKISEASRRMVSTFLASIRSGETDSEGGKEMAKVLHVIAKLERIREMPTRFIYEAILTGLTELTNEVGMSDELDEVIALTQGILVNKKLY